MIKINAPAPSEWTKYSDIDDAALVCNQIYREQCGDKNGFPVAVEHFADACLEASIEHTFFKVPTGAIVSARCKPDERDPTRFVIQFNETHREFFKENPAAHRAVGSHEAGHIVLKHHNKLGCALTPSLFEDFKPEPKCLHKTEWKPDGVTAEQIEALRRLAVKGNDEARAILLDMDNHLEEKWMFMQAEHFVKCFLIPKDRLMEVLELNYDFTAWRTYHELGEEFGVRYSMVVSRLKNLKIIEVGNDKRISLGRASRGNLI